MFVCCVYEGGIDELYMLGLSDCEVWVASRRRHKIVDLVAWARRFVYVFYVKQRTAYEI